MELPNEPIHEWLNTFTPAGGAEGTTAPPWPVRKKSLVSHWFTFHELMLVTPLAIDTVLP